MALLKRGIPTIVAVIAGLATLTGLLLLPDVSNLILEWAAFLATVALLLGILNLLSIHLRRTVTGNMFSLVLVAAMLAMFGLALTDAFGFTEDGVQQLFTLVQVPLEAALASLLAFFLLFAGIRLWQQQRNRWSILFLLTVLLLLISQSPLPISVEGVINPVRSFIYDVIVTAGVRGFLLGVALGTVTLSLRLLAGLERPYSSS
ncbi:MAG: hypothetical protein RRC07_07465 [Anaerolineae bacterium]|nr:hypothetical protein [Anaerolineae bacterium]